MKIDKQPNIALCDYLKMYHTGKNKAASSFTLEVAFHLKGTQIRQDVNTLRRCDYPICSDQNGYYYAADENDIQRTVAQLTSRIKKINDAKTGLENSKSYLNITA